MGLLEAFSNILKGKLPYEHPDQNQSQTPATPGAPAPMDSQSQTSEPTPQSTGPKVIKEIRIDRAECQLNGQRLTCDAFIRNGSQVDLDLDRINILGSSYDLGEILSPGESKKMRIYDGNMPKYTSSPCRIEYRTKPEGDYFKANFTVDIITQGSTPEIRFRQLHTEDI